MKVLVVLRHANSLNIVRDYLALHDLSAILVALDPVDLPDSVQEALTAIKAAILGGIDAAIIGTKVYDDVKVEKTEPPVKLLEFLQLLKDWGIGTTPICMTHLAAMPDNLWQQIAQTGLTVSYVENDNLKNDGMTNLGPLVMAALGL